jgi:hypothetical protein
MFLHHRALAAVTLAVGLVPLGACSDDSTATENDATGEHDAVSANSSTPEAGPTTTEGSPGPTDLMTVTDGSPLEPGAYAVPLIGPESAMRAVVDVPEGYFNPGPWVIDDGDGTHAPDEFGELMFWADIDQVDPDPCKPGGTVVVGPTVRDLADALAAQENRTTTRSVPVTLHGNNGIYVESRGSQEAASSCRDGQPTLWQSDSYWDDSFGVEPGNVQRMWILDVDGQRVVALVNIFPGQTANPDEMAEIAESVRFTDAP